MFHIRKIMPACAALIIAAYIGTSPAAAQYLENDSAGFIKVGSTKHGLHHRSAHHVHRHFVPPTAKLYKSKPSYYGVAPHKAKRHHGHKRHKHRLHVYKKPKHHILKSYKHRYGYKYRRH